MVGFLKATVQIFCAVILAIVLVLFIFLIVGPMEWVEKKMTAKSPTCKSPPPAS